MDIDAHRRVISALRLLARDMGMRGDLERTDELLDAELAQPPDR